MRLLFLAQRVPYPPDRGDKITTFRLVERLARRHDVRVVAFAHGPADVEAAARLAELGIPTRAIPLRAPLLRHALSLAALPTSKPLTLVHYGSRAMQRAVDGLVSSVDAAYAYSSSMGAFLLPHTGLPRIMHMAELDSDKWLQLARRGHGPLAWIHAREARLLLPFEDRLARGSRTNVFCTPVEQRLFEERIPGARSIVLRNGVDLAAFRPQPERSEPDHLVFTGVMDYLPNVDGCAWFADEIFPLVRERRPAARFSIVGSSPSRRVLGLARRPGITVTGRVPDTADWLARAAVAVAPLRIARGIQNKVLEALAMGLPVVGTTSATRGVEGVAGEHYVVADDARGQADAIVALLEQPAEARRLGAAARAFVEARYDWESTLAELDPLIASLAPKP